MADVERYINGIKSDCSGFGLSDEAKSIPTLVVETDVQSDVQTEGMMNLPELIMMLNPMILHLL